MPSLKTPFGARARAAVFALGALLLLPATALPAANPTAAPVAADAAEPAAQSGAPLEVLGQYDPGTPNLNAMAVGLDGIAYLGSWGSASDCRGLGVRVIDVRDPTAPYPLSTAAAYGRTIAEHVAALRWDSATYSGNLLMAGIQRCSNFGAGEGGLAVWDVTDPANPRELSYVSSGRATRGVHEFTVGRLGNRLYAYLAVSNSETGDGRGDLRVVDLTDPLNPVEITDWSASRDAGLRVGSGGQCAPACRGVFPQAFLHSVALSPDNRTAYLSYWDLGVIMLDVADPAAPRFLGRFAYAQAAEGNTHSVAIAHEGRLALVADETFAPPWGRVRLVDVQDPARPVQIGNVDTANGAAGTPGASETWYSVHNPVTDDRDPYRAYFAWYADGVRYVDVRDPAAPYEVASFVPRRDPMVWSAIPVGDVILVGDVNNGLYVLRR